MPASQLKRLKQSLRDSGVTGSQKSKKQKKQLAASKDQTRRNDRAAALQNIRDSFNPFELKATNSRPAKFEHASASNGVGTGKYKAVLHRPGVSKSVGEEMRRATLLPEMRRRNKVGGLVDRRIGEGDADMTPEERAAARFAREAERKSKGRSVFDLEGSDEEGRGFQLTHGGKGVGDLAADDFDMSISGGSDDEGSDGSLFRKKRRRGDVDDGEDAAAGGKVEAGQPEEPERKKTKKEVMEEVIAKSKMHKYERQKAKEDDEDLREELDKGFDEIFGLLKGAKKLAPPQPVQPAAVNGSGPVINADRQRLLDGMDRETADREYDIRMKQLAMDARAKPSNKTLTAEEKAQKEAQTLKEMEDKRQKRMHGEDVSDDEATRDEIMPQLRGDDEEIPDQAAEFGLTSSLPKQQTERDVQPDEDEFEYDEDLIASDSEASVSHDDSDASSDEAQGEDGAANEEDEFIKEVLGPEASTGANTRALGERRTGADASGLSYTYPCPRSHAELVDVIKDVPVEKLTTVIQRIRALYHPSLSASNKESMADFSSALVEHVAWMGNHAQPVAIIEQVIRHLHSLSRTYPAQIGEAFRRGLASFQERGQCQPGDLVLLTAISSIYPTSDHWHQVVTPAITLVARWLALNVPTASKPADASILKTGASMVALAIKYQSFSRRYLPEAIRFTARVLALGSSRVSGQSAIQQLLRPYLVNLSAMADLWKDKSAFIEIFSPVVAILKRLEQNPLLKGLSIKTPHRNISIIIQQSRAARRPLELHHHRPQPIRTSIPKFEENFNPDKHYDPDKERSEASKLKKEYKRERKGALRELRKDANFVAREQLKEKRERDAEYEKKYRRLIAEVQNEEGAASKDYERAKATRTAEKKRGKK